MQDLRGLILSTLPLFTVRETSICSTLVNGTMIWYLPTMLSGWCDYQRTSRTIGIILDRTSLTKWRTFTSTPVSQSNLALPHQCLFPSFSWQLSSYFSGFYNSPVSVTPVISHFHGRKLCMCLSNYLISISSVCENGV